MKAFSRILTGRLRRIQMPDVLLPGLCVLSLVMLMLCASAEKTALQDLLLYEDKSAGQTNEIHMTPVHALQQENKREPQNAVLEEDFENTAAKKNQATQKHITPVTEIEKPLTPPNPVNNNQTSEETPALDTPEKKNEKKEALSPKTTSTDTKAKAKVSAQKNLPPLNPPPEELLGEGEGESPILIPDPIAEEASPPEQAPSPTQKPEKAESSPAPPSDLETSPQDLASITPQPPDNPEEHAQTPKGKEKEKKPEIIYKPLEAMVVFPVLRHGADKAFGDVAILFATEFAQQLESKFPQTRIHNPIYSAEELRLRGLGRIYNQMIDYYIKAGRPEPRALNFLLSELAQDGLAIERAIFVEADVDLHHQTRSWRPKDLFMKWHSGALPDEQRYYVMTRIQIYDTSSPHQPKVWSYSWNQPVKTTGLYNVTASVFQDSDSITLFSRASRMMNRALLLASPKRVYMEGVTDIGTNIHGEVVNSTGVNTNTSTQSGRLNDADRRAIERLLRKQ